MEADPGVEARGRGRAATLPALQADLILLHAPAYFDFRRCREVYFPFWSTTGDVAITPLYEYFPVGFRTLKQHLEERGHSVRIVNLSTLLLRFPELEIDAVLGALEARLVGIDLHWMVHVQGALAVAERLKQVRPDIPVIFGGISSSYYADELVRYPFVDMVMRGYDTHAPLDALLSELKRQRRLDQVPNLLWKTAEGQVKDNGLSHFPAVLGCGMDWSSLPGAQVDGEIVPTREFVSTHTAGCSFDCRWCGGSRSAFRRTFGRKHSLVRKPQAEVAREFASLAGVPQIERYHYYAIGSYNETPKRLDFFLDRVARAGFRSISYEQYHLTPEHVLRRMVQANPRTTLTLSPESHDQRIARLAGRGVYTNAEMEAWIARAFEIGIHQVDIWYFIGMPGQDERSALETVDYCRSLLEKFRGCRLYTMICPMMPFLDPASEFFERPEPNGYRLFYRSVEDHRRGMERAALSNRLNYETRWLTRQQIVEVGFRAIADLLEIRSDVGQLPRSMAGRLRERLRSSTEFNRTVAAADDLPDPADRRRALDELGDEIERRNQELFFSGVANQSFPLARKIGGRWFDETGWDEALLLSLR